MRMILLVPVAALAVGCPAFDSYVTPKDPSLYPCGHPGYSSCAPQEGCCPEKTFCNQYGGCTDSTDYPTYSARRLPAKIEKK